MALAEGGRTSTSSGRRAFDPDTVDGRRLRCWLCKPRGGCRSVSQSWPSFLRRRRRRHREGDWSSAPGAQWRPPPPPPPLQRSAGIRRSVPAQLLIPFQGELDVFWTGAKGGAAADAKDTAAHFKDTRHTARPSVQRGARTSRSNSLWELRE